MLESSSHRVIKYKTFFLIMIFFSCIGSAKSSTFFLTSSDDIKSAIENGQAGDIFLLSSGNYINPGPIHIPNGITISGEEKTVIYQANHNGSVSVLFDVSDSTGVIIKDINIVLGAGSSAISNNKNHLKSIIRSYSNKSPPLGYSRVIVKSGVQHQAAFLSS